MGQQYATHAVLSFELQGVVILVGKVHALVDIHGAMWKVGGLGYALGSLGHALGLLGVCGTAGPEQERGPWLLAIMRVGWVGQGSPSPVVAYQSEA